MNTPLISVIVPVYNTEEYLENTVKLLREQTYKNLEIILVDDGSSDSSPAVCDSLAQKDSRIKVIHQPNSGVCAARNAGIAAAKGEYIGFCDSDDIPDINLYETLYRLAADNDCDMVSVGSRLVFTDGKVQESDAGELIVFENKDDALRLLLLNKMHTSVYTKLFSRELCRKISFPVGHKINEDKYYTFCGIVNCRKMCYSGLAKYTYVRRENSSSAQRFSDKFLDIAYFAEEIDKTVCRDYPHLKNYSQINKVICSLRLTQLIFLLGGEKEYGHVLKESLAYLKSVDMKLCRKLMAKNYCIKLAAARMGRLAYKASVKVFSKL